MANPINAIFGKEVVEEVDFMSNTSLWREWGGE